MNTFANGTGSPVSLSIILPVVKKRNGETELKIVNWFPVCFQSKSEVVKIETIASNCVQELHSADMMGFEMLSVKTIDTP